MIVPTTSQNQPLTVSAHSIPPPPGLCGKNLTRWCDHISKLPAVEISVADMPKITRGSDRKTEGKKGGKEEGGLWSWPGSI